MDGIGEWPEVAGPPEKEMEGALGVMSCAPATPYPSRTFNLNSSARSTFTLKTPSSAEKEAARNHLTRDSSVFAGEEPPRGVSLSQVCTRLLLGFF